MALKTPEFQIEDSKKPFDSDKLGRADSAHILTELITSTDDSLVLTIDSPWGTGKTSFIKMWAAYLAEDGFHTLSFNAWENDFSEDPLISFIGEMQSSFESINKEENEKLSSAIKNATVIGAKITKAALPLAAKILTYGVVDLEGGIEKALADHTSKIISSKINDYEADKASFKEFRNNLEELVSALPGQREKNPLVFFIDELDRCRPSYAVELLERIKHLFAVPGIIFVLAIDKHQLSCSVKMLYGSDMNVEGYLRRFLDIEYKLPTPNPESYPIFLAEIHQLENLFLHKNATPPDQYVIEILNSFTPLSEIFGLTLRDQEKCFAYLELYIKISEKNRFGPLPLAVALIILKLSKPNMYRQFIENKSNSEDITKLLRENTTKTKYFDRNRSGIKVLTFIKYSRFGAREIISNMESLAATLENRRRNAPRNDEGIRTLQIEYEALGRMSEHPGMIDEIIKKIEIGDRFKD